MPKLLRVALTPDQHRELRERLRARGVAPHTRLRLECLRLMARGMTVPQVADLVECHQVTVREAVHRFRAGGFRGSAGRAAAGEALRHQW